MRSNGEVKAYTGSVFLTKTLMDSEGKPQKVMCEAFGTIAQALRVPVQVVIKLHDRGGIDGSFFEMGMHWAPVPVRFLSPGQKPRWSRV